MRCFALSRTSSTTERPYKWSKDDPSSYGRGTTWIRNETEHTIVLRDKYRQQLGRLRHTIPPNSERKVEVDVAGVDTYYQMAVLMATKSRGKDHGGTDSGICKDQGRSTDICIDTDDMAVHNKIILSVCDDKFSIEKIKRKQRRQS